MGLNCNNIRGGRFLIMCLLLCFCHLGNTGARAGQYVFSHFSTEDGLPSNHIHDITQDNNGFVWVATHYGVSRFEGNSFRNFLSSDYPTMFRDDMYHSLLMKDGNVAFGGAKGTLVMYDDHADSFADLAPNDSFLCDITGYALSPDGDEFISTTDGVYSVSYPKSLRRLDIAPVGMAVYEVFKDSFRQYWLGVNHGVEVFADGGTRVAGFEPLARIGEQVNNICPVDATTVLLCASTGSLWMVKLSKNGTFASLKKVNAPFKNVSEICFDGTHVWIGTAGAGLWVASFVDGSLSFERCKPINRDDSDVRKISALFCGADGKIWVGTQNTGLWCVTDVMQSEVVFSADLGVPMVTGTSFFENADGRILMGTDGQGLYMLDSLGNVERHLTENEGLSSNNILSLRPYRGHCLVSYWGGAVSCLNPHTLANIKLNYKGLTNPSLNAKFADSDSAANIYVCLSGDGVYRGLESGDWSRLALPQISGSADKWTNHICFSADSVAWLSTTRTVWRITNDGMAQAVYPDTEGKSNHKPVELHQCATDEVGNAFLASSNGVYRLSADGRSIEHLDFLPSGDYCTILRSDDGVFWTAGTNGVLSFSYERKTFSAEMDGLDGHDRDFFIPRSIFMDDRNRLFLGTKQGFVMLNTAVKSEAKRPYVVWSDLYMRGKKVRVGSSELLPVALPYMEGLALAYNQTDLSLKFDAVDFSARNAITAFYRIEGVDTVWAPVGEDRTVGITQLPPGDYILQVSFFCKGEPIEGLALEMSIAVSPPWWRSWWFYTLVVMLVVLSASLYFFSRIRNITRQKVELERMVSERTKELRDVNLSLQQREKEVELQNDMLHNALKDKDRLVSIVAHDLKNPMFSIVGSLEDLVRQENGKENTLLRQVYQASAVLQRQMLKLLDWTAENRISASCDFQYVDLKEIVSEVTALVRGLLSDKDIRLSVDINAAHYLYVDPRMLSAIIRNLLTNAVKFTEKGKTITLTAAETEKNVVSISLRDEGVGMSAETVERLLSGVRLTSDGTLSEKGYGLGFGIVQEFVKKNKGELRIESEIGKGSTITVDFACSDKLIEQEVAKRLACEEKPLIDVNRELLQGKTVLVVDDDPLILLHLKNILSKFVNVVTAANGEDGLKVAKSAIPDLILSDVEMPVLGGMEMFDALRKNSLTSNIPFLFLSAINEESLRLRGLARGAIDYIPKPFNERELIMKACNVLSVLKRQQLDILMSAMEDKEPVAEQTNPLLAQLLDVVKEHYQEAGYSFDDMAVALGMSKSTLSRRLKSLTDKSPVEILSDYRLNKARQMLLSGTASVSDVAYSVGFSDPLYFSRKFKEAFGCPPSKVK